jgi:serine/threonine-protein kinase
MSGQTSAGAEAIETRVVTTTGRMPVENTTTRPSERQLSRNVSLYSPAVLTPGTLVDRYELVSPVGEGGMAHVWVARQKGKHGFEKLFAFKYILPRFSEHHAFRSMFLDEARIASSIEHPNVAQVFDLGEHGSMLYLVMEYVDGESLGALMTAASRRANAAVPVPTGIALRIIADACAGLQAAHTLKDASGNPRGVVHRDVSPQNILVSVRGDVKVIDFGIAMAKDRVGGDTDAGSLKGKLHYMAPEQVVREPLGPYTDVFAAGATLYRMLAGHPPFDGGNDAATIHKLVSGGAPDPLPDSVPPLVAAIVERALDRDPGNRYQTALAMQTALEAAIMDEGYVTDVATWVTQNLSDDAIVRRAKLAARAPSIASVPAEVPSFLADLPVPDRPRPTPPVPAEPRVTAPAPASARELVAPTPAAMHVAIAPIGLDSSPPSGGTGGSTGPGMLDVRALVARAKSPSAPDVPPRPAAPNASAAPPAMHADHDKAAPAREAPRYVGPATKAVPENAGARGGAWTKLAILVTVIVLVLAGVLLLLPMIVRDRIIANAREGGVELTVESVGIGFGGVSVRGITAKIQGVPGADLRADEIFATGMSGKEIRVRGLDVKLDGQASDVVPGLLGSYERNRARLAGTATDPRKIVIVSAHVAWHGVLGEGTSIEAGDVGGELESRGVGAEEIRASVGRFDVKTKRTTFGPWASTFERSTGTSRLRVLLDPPVPEGPSALVVWSKDTPARVTLRVQRSPLARLGIRPAELGLPADPGTEIEVKLEGGQSPSTRIEGTGRLDLFAVRLKGLKGPVDVKLEGAASGPNGKPLELEKTTVTLGPFLANVSGTITPTDLGFRLDAAWRTTPISCEKLARAEAKSMGPVAAALQDIAHATRVARVTGTANASGLVKYDTKTPDDGTMTLVTREACGLSIFGL